MIKIRPLPFFFIAALALATSTGCAGKQESGPSINKQESGPSINKTATPGLCQTITPFKKLFNAIDKAGKGYFQADDLKSFLDALVSWYVPSKITKEMSETAVKELDSNSDGQITLNEAVAAFKINIPSEIKHDHIPKMVCTTKALAIFDRFDKNSDNTLDASEIDAFLDELVVKGMPSLAQGQAKRVFSELFKISVDVNGDEKLQRRELVNIMFELRVFICSDGGCAP